MCEILPEARGFENCSLEVAPDPALDRLAAPLAPLWQVGSHEGVAIGELKRPMPKPSSNAYGYVLAELMLGWIAVLPIGAADWPQWRGPQRNGHSAETVKGVNPSHGHFC